ncbi:DNA/RNA helicase, superfamily II [uncultured Pleomorphomonas sp.]|uniref:DNA/RNA helicase, superfamily II n=1 Tax=uncultured Pleomorphomonas sp. TaxID=442121 RepID=A0A212LIA5_9HYPH|nr:DEAD/DEAH box helicase [uncultured Pleomorphomonas sp.]SCM77274.1 DNA/RNA helicase, superfamily II [uncultured Pleomorphomonas sp.]
MSFSQAHPALARALAARGYVDPTAVQSAVAAPALAGADMLVSARTGSGKTVAFGMALAERLLGPAEVFAAAGKPLALVVAPTRELALQVARELAWLYGETGARLVSCVGGMDPRREQRQLAQGAHIVVGTPGRLCDHLDRGNLDLADAVAVVLDEADEMLDLGFREDLEKLLGAAPADRQTLLFSATLPADIVRLARDFMRPDATRVDVAEDGEVHADIDYHAVRVFPHEIEKAVVNLLRFHDAVTSIVFCGTREGVKRLTGALLERGFSVVALSGEMGQGERNEALSALRDGRARVCVATDVAARGLDVPDLGLVVHADLPHDSEVLLHRSGRTGRAGRKGVSVLLVPSNRRRRAESLLAGAGIELFSEAAPSADAIRRLDEERLLADPLLSEEMGEDELAFASRLAEGRTAEELAAAFVRLARTRLPAPEEIGDPVERKPRRADAPERPKVRETVDFTGSAWFRLSVGRRDGAEVKRVLAFLCRHSGLKGRDFGAIRVGDGESFAEVAPGGIAALERLAAAGNDENVRIARADGPPAAAPARPRKDKPRREDDHAKGKAKPPRDGKPPYKEAPRDGKPPFKGKKKDRKAH